MLHSYATSSHLFHCEHDQLHPAAVQRILQERATSSRQKWSPDCLGHSRSRKQQTDMSKRADSSGPLSMDENSLLTFEEALTVLVALGRGAKANQRALFPFDPDAPAKQAWDVLIMLLLAYTTFSVPYLLAFGDWAQNDDVDEDSTQKVVIEHTFLSLTDLVLDIIFCTDVAMCFFTCYTAHGVYVTSIRAISWHYLRTWFVVDFMGSVPFDRIFIAAMATLNKPLDSMGRDALQGLRMIRVLKIVRAARFMHKLNQLEQRDSYGVLRTTLAVFRATFVMVFVAHFLACFAYICMDKKAEQNWMASYDPSLMDIEISGPEHRFVASFYWAVTTISTIGRQAICLSARSILSARPAKCQRARNFVNCQTSRQAPTLSFV